MSTMQSATRTLSPKDQPIGAEFDAAARGHDAALSCQPKLSTLRG